MSLNWREIDLVLQELQLEQMHVERVFQTDFRNLYLRLYHPDRRWTLRICLAHPHVRIHSVQNEVRLKRSHQRFESFLNSRIKSGRIIRAVQLEQDRVVLLKIHRSGEETRLYVRLWGPHSNIVATDADNAILDAYFRKPAQGLATGFSFEPPDHNTVPPEKNVRPRRSDVSFNCQIEEEYREKEEAQEAGRLKKELRRLLTRRRGQLLARRNQMERATDPADGHDLRHYGDLILSNLHRIQGGEHFIEVEDYENEGNTLVLTLDPTRTPQENAQTYYEQAKKVRDKGDMIATTLRQVQNNLDTVNEELEHIEPLTLEELRERVSQLAQEQKARKREGGADLPGLEFNSQGFRILVGRNANENDQLLRKVVKGNDYWLHTRDYPGGYVFVRVFKGKTVPLPVLLDAANLAVFFSKARSAGKADLYYTQVKYLRRAKEGPKGLVLPTQEKNLTVELDQERLSRLGIGDQSI